MAIFLVNQGKTYIHELAGSYIWSPKLNKVGGQNKGYNLMKTVRKGDYLFHNAGGRIAAISVVEEDCKSGSQPNELKTGKTQNTWDDDGWIVFTKYYEFSYSILTSSIVDWMIDNYREDSAFQKNGKLKLQYLCKLDDSQAIFLIDQVLSKEKNDLIRSVLKKARASTKHNIDNPHTEETMASENNSLSNNTFNRARWNKYETALLIEAFWEIEKNKSQKVDIATRLSGTLRAMAQKNGIQVDEKYRNLNGMLMQLISIGGEFFPERSRLTSSEMFHDMANIYDNDRITYRIVLNDAHKIAEKNENPDNLVSSQINIHDFKMNDKFDRLEAMYLIDQCISGKLEESDFEYVAKNVSEVLRRRAQLYGEIIDTRTKNAFSVLHKLFEIKEMIQVEALRQRDYLFGQLINMFFHENAKYEALLEETKDHFTSIEGLDVSNGKSVEGQPPIIRDSQMTKRIDSGISKLKVCPSCGKAMSSDALFCGYCGSLIGDKPEGQNAHEIIIDEAIFADVTSLEDDIFSCLQEESAKNPYGTTAQYIANVLKVPNQKVLEVLKKVEWATYKYGKYVFADSMEKSEQMVSFLEIPSLTKTQPIRMVYFSEEISIARSWRKLFYDFLKVIHDDYPHVVCACSSNQDIRNIVFDGQQLKEKITPCEFATNLYVDLDKTAQQFVTEIRTILNACNIDYENVEIEYCRIQETAIAENKKNESIKQEKCEKKPENNQEKRTKHYRNIVKDAFYQWMVKEQKVDRVTTTGYVATLQSAEDFARTKISQSLGLFIVDKEMIGLTALELYRHPQFQRTNEKTHGRSFNALKKYLEYLDIDVKSEKSESTCENRSAHTRPDQDILIILVKYYKYGFNVHSPIELIRFRRNYNKEFDKECAYTDNELIRQINDCGDEYAGKVYVITNDAKTKLTKMLDGQVNQGVRIFYYECVYEYFEDFLNAENIFSEEMLEFVLKNNYKKANYKKNFFTTNAKKLSGHDLVIDEIMRVWDNSALMNVQKLCELLPFIPESKLKYTLSIEDRFVWNSTETYTRKDVFTLDQDQLDSVIDFALRQCEEKGSTCFDELPTQEIREQNCDLSEIAFNDLLFMHMCELFDRNNVVLVKKGEENETNRIIYNYCSVRESCTLEELENEMKRSMGTVRNSELISAANEAMIRVSQIEFVADHSISFDTLQIDAILDQMIIRNGIGIREIVAFGAFPYCGKPWNLFLLESYCRRFSDLFCYDCITNNSNNVGAIIRKDSGMTYHEIMAESIAFSDVELTESDVFDYLIEKGFLMRRKYTRIANLIEVSSAIREGRE